MTLNGDKDDIKTDSRPSVYDHSQSLLCKFRNRNIVFKVMLSPLYLAFVIIILFCFLIFLLPTFLAREKAGRVQRAVSHTAKFSLWGRYYGYLMGLNEDSCAKLFVDRPVRVAIWLLSLSFYCYRSVYDFSSGVVLMMSSRTNYFDACIRYAVEEGKIENLVICGSGFDTRFLRLRQELNNVKIYEVDAKTTQQVKLSLLKKNHIEIPENTTMVEIDFSSQNLFQVLHDSNTGFDSSRPSLILWEGVSMYLSKKATDDFLQSVTSNLNSDSFLAMDQLWQIPDDDQWKYHGLRIGSKAAKNRGEPFSNGIPTPANTASIEAWFSHHDFSIIQHVQMNTSEAKRMYATISDGHVIGRSFEAENYFLLRITNATSV